MSLDVGDMIKTAGGDILPILWISKIEYTSQFFSKTPNARAVKIPAGRLGGGYPKLDLVVSRQHRVMLKSKICKRMFGQSEVLVPAKDLLDVPGIEVDNSLEPRIYVHFLLPRHEVILANGLPCESLFPGAMAFEMLDPDREISLRQVIDDVLDTDAATQPARQLVSGRKARNLVSRHLKNDKPLVSAPSSQSAKRKQTPLSCYEARQGLSA